MVVYNGIDLDRSLFHDDRDPCWPCNSRSMKANSSIIDTDVEATSCRNFNVTQGKMSKPSDGDTGMVFDEIQQPICAY